VLRICFGAAAILFGCLEWRRAILGENFAVRPVSKTAGKAFARRICPGGFHHHNLAVTWDSSKSNSYFYHPLGTTLAINDDFSMESISSSRMPWLRLWITLAVGFLNFAGATRTNFFSHARHFAKCG